MEKYYEVHRDMQNMHKWTYQIYSESVKPQEVSQENDLKALLLITVYTLFK